MQSKNKKAMTAKERAHVEKVREAQCAVCDGPGGEAHEIVQGQWYTSIGLCADCHRGSVMGWHGQKRAWLVRKLDELSALNITLSRVNT